ncbi:hypothetical protein [uncultured Enterovirga sp.]|uniref:hypothetical protein n=1 Tax=uncultured Enterovirga sp. TaxID=2026352 RepID=UPI0035CA28CD
MAEAPPTRRGRLRPALPLVAGIALGALTGCLDLVSLREVAFPPTVPGLAADRAWQPLPVGILMSEAESEAVALAVCSPPGCGPEAAVGVFRAGGPSGDLLLADAANPARLVATLGERRRLRSGRTGPARTPSTATSEPIRIGAFGGFILRLSRTDGSRDAYGVALAARRDGKATVVVVVAPREDEARRIARDVASSLG